MPDYAIYFSSYFFGSIPDRNHTDTGSVPQDECKISCFWKSNHGLSFKLSLFYNTNCNIISSSLSKNSLSTTWPLIEMTGQQHHHLITLQFHFIPVIKTIRQPFNHHTFCTPLAPYRHCSVSQISTIPVESFSAVELFCQQILQLFNRNTLKIPPKPLLINNLFCRKTTHSDSYK